MEVVGSTFRDDGYRAGFESDELTGPGATGGSALPQMLYEEGHASGVSDRALVESMKASISELISDEELESYSFEDFSAHLDVMLEYEKRDGEGEGEFDRSNAFLQVAYEELKKELTSAPELHKSSSMRMG